MSQIEVEKGPLLPEKKLEKYTFKRVNYEI